MGYATAIIVDDWGRYTSMRVPTVQGKPPPTIRIPYPLVPIRVYDPFEPDGMEIIEYQLEYEDIVDGTLYYYPTKR